jgi:hypothetical protein
MKKKYLLIVVCLLSINSFGQSSETTGSLTWSVSNNTLIIRGTGAMPDYGSVAFPWINYASQIEIIIIENGVTRIGDYAFYGCSRVTSVSIPNSVITIGNSSFRDCSGLTSVIIPNSIVSIEDFAFSGCTGLISMTVPDSVLNIGGFVFTNCSRMTSITLPNSITSIPDCVFQNCIGLTSINIPNSVESIGFAAFLDCKGLASVVIPNSVTYIQTYAFGGCVGLEHIYVESIKPATCTDITFDGANKTTCTLHVPNNTKPDYSTAIGWKDFFIIQENTLGLMDFKNNKVLVMKAYPNPTTGTVYIETLNNSIPDIKVYDLGGKQLIQNQGNDVDLTAYSKGIYLLQVDGKMVKVVKK